MISMEQIVEPLLGGILIGAAAGGLLLINGRVFGISGILAGVLKKPALWQSWHAYALAGLVLGGLVLNTIRPDMFGSIEAHGPLRLIAAGLLVGYGTRLGSGCTSGHGVCGISRMSKRSITATLVFMAAGIVTVALQTLFFGG